MKVLITTDLFTVTTNGVVTSVRNLRDELESKGHEVRILTFADGLDSYKDGNVYYIKSLPLEFVYPDVRMPISFRNAFVEELIAWKPDVIHSQCEFFSYHFAKEIAKYTGAPIVHTYHTLYEEYVTYVFPIKSVGAYVMQEFSRIRLKDADKIIAPTTKVEKVLRNYGVENEIHVVPSGLSLQQHDYRLTEEEKKQKRNSLGIPEDHKVLLNLGRLGTEKNLDELMDYFFEALQKNSNLTFLIVGDGPAKKDLELMVKEYGIESNVVFTGMVSPEEVQKYYQLGDLFISASTSETQGLTYIEAAANGLPLLCRQDECLCDIIIDGLNGYQYTSKEDFIDKLNVIMKDAEWCSQAGKHSEDIAKGFDKSHFGDTVEGIYKDCSKTDTHVKGEVICTQF